MNQRIGRNIIMIIKKKGNNLRLKVIIIIVFIFLFFISSSYGTKEDQTEGKPLKRWSVGLGIGEEYHSLVKVERFHSWGNIEYILLKQLYIKFCNTPLIIYGHKSIGIYCWGGKYYIFNPIFIEGGFGFSLADEIHNIEKEEKKYGYGWFNSIGYNININDSFSLSPELKYFGAYIDKENIYVLGLGIGFYYRF